MANESVTTINLLATLVALHFTPVSESLSRWAEFRTSVAWSLQACFLQNVQGQIFQLRPRWHQKCPHLFLFKRVQLPLLTWHLSLSGTYLEAWIFSLISLGISGWSLPWQYQGHLWGHQHYPQPASATLFLVTIIFFIFISFELFLLSYQSVTPSSIIIAGGWKS